VHTVNPTLGDNRLEKVAACSILHNARGWDTRDLQNVNKDTPSVSGVHL
jgi:hypothetical protein